MRYAGHIKCMDELINAYKIMVERLKEINHLEDLGVDA
jgi:hypothetical protein